MTTKNNKIDESLYSRQLYVLGHEAMNSMRNSKVLISGLGGVGLELAKCVVLAGISNVTLHDDKITRLTDLSTQYYAEVGKPRLESAKKLKELNPYVEITMSSEPLQSLILKGKYDMVVLTDHTFAEVMASNGLARSVGSKFSACISYGCFGFIFNDFGDNFMTKDPNGEEQSSGIVTELCYAKDGTLLIQTAEPHNLSTNDEVIVTGFDAPLHVFDIEDTRKFCVKTKHNENATLLRPANVTFQQVKKPKVLQFKKFTDALTDPQTLMVTDIMDPTRPNTLHALYQAVDRYTVKNNRLPGLWNEKDADELLDFTTQIYADADKSAVRKLSYTLQGQLCPLHAFFGSIGAQEVLKGCSGKFHPIHQWFYYDVASCVPKSKPEFKVSDRYLSQRMVFGDEFQDRLLKSNVFVVGSGAIGSEHLKNFAMMGVGNLLVTDMDRIEKSNLNRQFLFRHHDIGKPKSDVACREIKKMNPNISVKSHQNRVGPETESIYDEKFFAGLTCVANALDNVQARLYMDERCITYQKPLLESGTLGTKGNVQTIIPHLTESYGTMRDPPEQSVPVCTLKNFPYLIDHTIQSSRDLFEGYFVQAPSNVIKYLNNKSALQSMTPTEAISITNDIKQVVSHVPETYDDCTAYAYQVWHELFRDQILQLLHKFPPEHKTAEGVPFWSGAKKCPVALTFDSGNDMHLGFIQSFANLWADVFGIRHGTSAMILKKLSTMKPEPFKPNDDAKISATEEEEKARLRSVASGTTVDDLIASMSTMSIKRDIKPLCFEKDDDSNFHIDFITSASNLRATNYGITVADRHKTKGIAGKIIPAIGTTTSLVSALVSIELYKLISGANDITSYRNSFVNLALPYFGFSEPIPAKQFKLKNTVFTFWDSVRFDDVKLETIITYFKDKYSVDVSNVTVGQAMLYSEMLSARRKKERLNKTISEIYTEITEEAPKASPMMLTIISDDDSELPPCKVYLRSQPSATVTANAAA